MAQTWIELSLDDWEIVESEETSSQLLERVYKLESLLEPKNGLMFDLVNKGIKFYSNLAK